MSLLIPLLALAASQPVAPVEITNFRFGLVCSHTRRTEDESGWICQPTQDIPITDQGSCIFNGEKKRCTWYGFEFAYKAAQPGAKLQCTTQASRPFTAGNPSEELGESTTHSYELELEQRQGRFFNPQYTVFAVRSKENSDIRHTTVCRSEGAVVFEYSFTERYPVLEN